MTSHTPISTIQCTCILHVPTQGGPICRSYICLQGGPYRWLQHTSIPTGHYHILPFSLERSCTPPTQSINPMIAPHQPDPDVPIICPCTRTLDIPIICPCTRPWMSLSYAHVPEPWMSLSYAHVPEPWMSLSCPCTRPWMSLSYAHVPDPGCPHHIPMY